MANKVLNSRVVMKHDTNAHWALATAFVPLAGEIIVYTDLNKFKIGDGTTVVGSLPFATSDALPEQSSSTVNKFLMSKLVDDEYEASWEDITNFPVVSTATGTIAAGSTSTSVTFTGTYINAYAKNSSGAIVLTDITIGSGTVTFEINEALSEALTCIVVSTSTSVTDANQEEF